MKKILDFFKRLNPYYDPYEFCGPEERVRDFLSLLAILISLIALFISIK